ncbi:unnamed protein product [Peniophora sp. CBMAI 1063]|nr:unnamed protein product [Peniophora sp. CBMAI 1063]
MNTHTPDASSSREYDFVIVGGGTAGLVLAARLTENANVTVGIIEAGGDHSDAPPIKVPGMVGQAFGNEDLDWNFKTVPQVGAKNRVIACPRGKGVGGSSAINYMVYTRANSTEYDAIEALGNDGWNWSSFLQYMKKAETFSGPSVDAKERYRLEGNDDVHGFDGPLKISYSTWFNQLHAQFIDALVDLGVPVNIDPTGGVNSGVYTGMLSVDPTSAVRSHAGNAYYQPNADRPNLQLLSGAHVTRVVLDLADGKYVAKGVEYLKDGQKHLVRAKREVILCCGSIQTPLVLELSGIGLSDVLNKHEISQLIDLPVGENLLPEDHPWVPFIHEVDKNTETLDDCADEAFLNKQIKLYHEQQRGILSSPCSGCAHVPLDRIASPDALAKLVRAVQDEKTAAGSETLQQQLGFVQGWFSDPRHPMLEILQLPAFHPAVALNRKSDPSCRYHTLLLINLHPLSRGSVHISSSAPTARPLLDPGFLRNPVDVDVLVHAVRFAKSLIQTESYRDSKPALYEPPEDIIEDDEKLRDFIREHIEGIYHPVGTCSMLPKKDGGVVDTSLLFLSTARRTCAWWMRPSCHWNYPRTFSPVYTP